MEADHEVGSSRSMVRLTPNTIIIYRRGYKFPTGGCYPPIRTPVVQAHTEQVTIGRGIQRFDRIGVDLSLIHI